MLAVHAKQAKEKHKKQERVSFFCFIQVHTKKNKQVEVKKNGTHLSFEFVIVDRERTDQMIYDLREHLLTVFGERPVGRPCLLFFFLTNDQ